MDISIHDDKELEFAVSLANPKFRGAVRGYLDKINWSSVMASKIVDFFIQPDLDGQPFVPRALYTHLSEDFVRLEIQNILNACMDVTRDFRNDVNDQYTNQLIKSFIKFYQTRVVQDVLRDNQHDTSRIIAKISELREIGNKTIPVWNMSELDVATVLEEELGASSVIPTHFNFVRRATGAKKGYSTGQVCMVCFTGDTKVMTAYNGNKTLQQMYDDGDRDIRVLCVNSFTNLPMIAIASHVELTAHVTRLCEIEFCNGGKIRCTPDHLFLTSDPCYTKASHLKLGESLCTIKSDPEKEDLVVFKNGHASRQYLARLCEFFAGDKYILPINEMEPPYEQVNLPFENLTVSEVRFLTLDEPVPVYDLIDVEFYHNFVVSTGDEAGVVVHNCAPPGVGKTLFLAHEVVAMMRHNQGVDKDIAEKSDDQEYVAEMEKQKIRCFWLAAGDMMRIDFINRLTAIYLNESLTKVTGQPHKYFNDEVKHFLRYLDISAVPASYIDAYGVKHFVETQLSERDPNVVIIDYDSNLLTSKGDDMYKAGEEVYNVATAIARPIGRPGKLVFVASQPKISFWDADMIPLEAAAESSRKQAVIDMMITIGKNPVCLNDHAGVMQMPKNRRGTVGEKDFYKLYDGHIHTIDKNHYDSLKIHGVPIGSKRNRNVNNEKWLRSI